MKRQKFLQTLKRYGEKHDIPNISEKNAQFLRNILQEIHAHRILEIGSANGYSTIQFADKIESWG